MGKDTLNYQINFSTNLDSLQSQIKKMAAEMGKIKPDGDSKFANIVSNIDKAFDRLRGRLSKPITSSKAFSAIESDVVSITAEFDTLTAEYAKLSSLSRTQKLKLLPDDIARQLTNANQLLKDFEKELNHIDKVKPGTGGATKKLGLAEMRLLEAEAKLAEKYTAKDQSVELHKKRLNLLEQQITALKRLKETQEAYDKAAESGVKVDRRKKLVTQDGTEYSMSGARTAVGKVVGKDAAGLNGADLQAQIVQLEQAKNEALAAAESASAQEDAEIEGYKKTIADTRTEIENLKKNIADIEKVLGTQKTDQKNNAFTKLYNDLQALGVKLDDIDPKLGYTENGFEALKQKVGELTDNKLSSLNSQIEQTGTTATEASTGIDQLGREAREAGNDFDEVTNHVKQFNQIKSYVQQFIGFTGAINLARNAIRKATESIKELDATMTEMSVVTDESIGGYWDQLPTYTKRANELGVAINSVYESDMLLYQQGLKTNQVVEISTEALKMARIAGLDAEEATNRLTSAIRGFGMELDQVSAERVSDVYSELAALSASDVDELSTAMSKTASIASSAGASFENTSAFLAQMIETTREAPDAIGTSLKTVIARFTELKKAPSEIGEVDGEIVDANAIETALRSVGIALRDEVTGQLRDFDDIILELAAKWDTLDSNTQHYIATISAGSRQQSRFLALLSDYDRLLELTAAAEGAAGASNEQYQKTLDSLESKLAKLDNAWTTFTTTVINSNLYKGAIDLLSGVVNAINDITSALDGNTGIAKIGLLAAAMKAGNIVIQGFAESWKGTNNILGSISAGFKAVGNSVKKTAANIKKAVKGGGLGDSSEITKATAERVMAEKELATVQAQINQSKKDGIYNGQTQIALDKLETEAAQKLTAATAAETAARKLSAAQIKESLAMQELGVAKDTAELFAKQGITASNVKLAASVYGVAAAELTEEQVRTIGNASLLKKLHLTITSTVAEVAGTKATWLHDLAQKALNGSVLASVGLYALLAVGIAAVVAVVWLLVKAYEKMQAQMPDEQLKKAQAATQAAADAATAAADAYDDLSNSLSELSNKYSVLEDMTKGTDEWKEATNEINKEVMDLVDEYKELAQYATYEDGVMKIDIQSDEVQEILQGKEIEATNAKMAEQTSKIQELEYQADVDVMASDIMKRKETENLIGSIVTGLLVGGTAVAAILGTVASGGLAAPALAWGAGALTTTLLVGGVAAGVGTGILVDSAANLTSQEYLEKRAKLFSDESLYIDENGKAQVVEGKESEFEDLAQELGFINTRSALSSLSEFSEEELEELQELGENYRQVAEYEKSINEIIRGQMKDLIDTQTKTKSENAIIDTLSKDETVTARYQAEALEEVKAMNNTEFINKMREIYGDTFEEKDGKYYVNGSELTDVTKESLQAQAASVIAAHKVADALEKVAEEAIKTSKNFSNLNKQQAFIKLFSKDEGAALTEATMETAKEFGWNDIGPEAQAYFGSEESYLAWRDEQIKLAETTLQVAQERMNRALGTTNFEFTDKDVEVGALGGLSARLEKIGYASGTSGANEVMSLLDSLTKDMTDEQKSNLYNQLSAFEWNDMSAWDDLPETLEAIGISVPLEALDDFIAKTSALAQATYSVDFSKLTETLTETAKIIKEIRSGSTDRKIDESTYEQLIKSDSDLAKQFARNLDGEYVYLGSSMDNLADRIEDLTTEAARVSRENLGEQIKVGNYLESDEGWQARSALKSFVDKGGFTQDEGDKLKNLVVDVLESSGIEDYSKLGIEGFTNKTDLSTVFTSENKEFAMEIVSAIFGYATNLSTNKTSAETYDTQIKATGRQLKDASLNQGMEKGFSEALITQASTAGINSKIIDEYSTSLEKYNKMSNKTGLAANLLKKRILALEKQMVNSTNIINRDANMATAIEGISDLAESYQNAATEAQKFAIVGQMASDFNLKVTKDNYEKLGNYLSNYASGDYNSFIALVQESAEQASVSIGSINATTWTEAVLEAYPIYKDFFDMLISQGAGAFDANHNWIWTTKQEFEAMTEASGANAWENSYDWIYNYTEQVNALTREREKLERKFEKTLENEKYTAEELRDITLEEVDALKRRANMSGDAALKAQDEIEALFEKNSKFSDYLVYNQASGAITANYPALNDITDQTFGEDFDDFIDKLEELRDTYQDAVDDLEDIEDDLEELSKRGRDEYSELIDKVQEALIDSYQDIIDERSELNSAIKEAQDAIVDRMQEQIDATRQARENEKTESDLSDKRLRLAALMRDTSGSNAAEIKSLRKEIEDAETDYTDSLVDQALERLQDANEKAAEQRERQIELAQAQLDAYNESNLSYDYAQQKLDATLDAIDGAEDFTAAFEQTELWNLLKNQTDAMNTVAWEDWSKDLKEDGAIATTFKEYGDQIKAETAVVQAQIDAYKQKVDNIDKFLGNADIAKYLKGDEPYSIKLEDGTISSNMSDISANTGLILNALENKQEDGIESVTVYTGQAGQKGYKGPHAGSVTYTPYATGGLADYTGPAWLDGTPSKPELVLNPTDTANFIVLKDILSSLLGGGTISPTDGRNGGDNYYDIAISVDSLGDDYDVEQMVEKVRNMIYEDSIYRNVNTINSVK